MVSTKKLRRPTLLNNNRFDGFFACRELKERRSEFPSKSFIRHVRESLQQDNPDSMIVVLICVICRFDSRFAVFNGLYKGSTAVTIDAE